MVIDDSSAMRLILGRIMRSLGFDVVEAPNGAEAIARLQSGAMPEIALVDWNMPVMDGLAFVNAVRRGEVAPDHAHDGDDRERAVADRARARGRRT